MLQSKLSLLVLIGAFIIMAYAEELGSDCKCSYGPWTQSQCSAVCGSGVATKTRNCVCPSNFRGRPDCKGQPIETVTVSCDAGPCCSWGLPYTNWTNCTDGYMTRNQTCTCRPGAPVGSTCRGPSPIERMPCCSWGNFTNFTDCNVNCGGGNQTRFRPCICGTYDLKPVDKKKCYEDRRPRPPTPDIPNFCVGPSIETQVCNNFSCCVWGNFSEWSNCSSNLTCGGNQTRYAVCNCTYPFNISTPLTCPAYFNQTLMNVTALNISLFCEGPQPMETQFCPNCTNCTFSIWSNWTQCDQSCNGTQFRRQLCSCPGDNVTCPATYNDSLCVGVPLTETRQCNVSCCQWNFTENWSTCIADNNCCGNGTQWRRPVCTCDGVISPDFNCTYAGIPPLNQTRVCNISCCLLGPLVPVNCSQLLVPDPNALSDFCVTPWSERSCFCPDATGNLTIPSNFTQCLLDPAFPPISFNFSTDTCGDLTTNNDSLVLCTEFTNNSTCVAWNITFDANGQIIQIFDPITTANDSCFYSAPNCWDGWSEWSACCGACENGTQWRRQITSDISSCRTPPAFETRPCNISCCEWIFDNTTAFSNCSSICGAGTQWRFPYNCSCGNVSLCPIPPPIEVQNCTVPCCTFVNISDSTQCDLNNCSLPNFRWSSQRCLCNTTNSTSGISGLQPACSISDCFGVPIQNLTACPNCTTLNSTCEWRIVSISNCTGNCSKIVIVDAPYPGKEKDCKKDKWGKPVVQNATIIPVNGTQIITRACFCGNRQVAPGNCSSNFTTFTVQPCPLNCTCAWMNLTTWSACTCGKRYYTRMCNCSEIVCNSTTPRKSPSRPKYRYYDDDDDRRYKRDVSGGRRGDRDDDDDKKCTLPEPAYSYACGGYDIVFEDCPKPSSKKNWQVAEEIASTTVTENHTSEETSNNILTVIIPTIIIAVVITAAVVLVLMKNRNTQ